MVRLPTLRAPSARKTCSTCRPRRLTAPGPAAAASPAGRGCVTRVSAGARVRACVQAPGRRWGRRCARHPAPPIALPGPWTSNERPAGQGRGAARSGRPQSGRAGLQVPQISGLPPRALLAPCPPPPQPSSTARLRRSHSVLGGWEGWVWGRGGSGGGTRRRGCLCGRAPFAPWSRLSPPPSSSPGGAWHGGRAPAGCGGTVM